ncbi:MAG: hypothetical protein CMP73_01315 [Flavobacteriales bacterium]|nr:hypothetical protein [Flavobacteriales bacterium]|tara:strand:- start:49 stop:483 length:435 start_codon:yes stop_codon:yes gene_type:complete
MDFKDLPEEQQKFAISNKYDLLREKALLLKKEGIELCISDTSFDFKDVDINDDARKLIENGVQQIIDYRGLSFNRPFESLGVGGFYFLMSLFHFEMKRQLATHFDNYTIDQILLKNSLTENEMWLANKVEKIPDEVINKFSSKE